MLLFYFENAPKLSLTILNVEKTKCKYFDFARLLFPCFFSLANNLNTIYCVIQCSTHRMTALLVKTLLF